MNPLDGFILAGLLGFGLAFGAIGIKAATVDWRRNRRHARAIRQHLGETPPA